MPYIGNTPALDYISYAVQNFTVGTTTTYTLDYSVANENDIRLVVNNVIQRPGASFAYSATGTTLTLTSATLATDTMYAVFIGRAVQTVLPPANINIQLADGTAAAPSLNFANDTNTGIFRPTTDSIGFAEGGVEAMRIDSSANLKFNSGFGSAGTAYGCRAWVSFNGTGTPAIIGSGNVTSITDSAVGTYIVNFTNSMPDTNYTAITSDNYLGMSTADTYTVSTLRFIVWDTAANRVDTTLIGLAIFR